MYCPRCGEKLDENSMFCGNCGFKIDFNMQSPNKKTERNDCHENMKTDKITFCPNFLKKYMKKPILKNQLQNNILENLPKLEKLIGENTNYYIPEFQHCISENKVHFNGAAFVFWFFHAYKRDTIKELSYMEYHPFLLSGIAYLLGYSFTMTSFDIGSDFLFIVALAAFAVFFGAVIWAVVRLFKYAKNFNKIYMNCIDEKFNTQETANKLKDILPLVIFVITITIFKLLIGVIFA